MDLGGDISGGLPPLSELLAWTTHHLIDGATCMEGTADRWESIFTGMWQDVHTIDWQGETADATRARLTSDKNQVSGGAEKLRAGARVARPAASDVLSAQNRLRYAIEDAAEAGFNVYDDGSVEDTQVGGGADRQIQAQQFATTIYSRAKHLVGVDTHVSRRLNDTVGDIGNYFVFDEPDGVQLVDYHPPLSPGAPFPETPDQAGNDAIGADGGAGGGPPQEPGLPPPGLRPPAEGELTPGEPSRAKERRKGAIHLWDKHGGEWRYHPEDSDHNPHWDYNPHDRNNPEWEQIPIGGAPPMKPEPLPPPSQSPISISEPNLSPVEKAGIAAVAVGGGIVSGLWWLAKHAAHPFATSP
jgi:hypothetical protein